MSKYRDVPHAHSSSVRFRDMGEQVLVPGRNAACSKGELETKTRYGNK